MTFDPSGISPITGLWLVASSSALVLTIKLLRDHIRDRDANDESVANGLKAARVVVIDGLVFRARVRVLIFAWWTLLGLLFGMFEMLPETPLRLAGLLGLIATAFGWSAIGLQEAHERKVLDEIIEQAHRARDGMPETQDQREDREFGEQRRILEGKHNTEREP